MYHASAHAYQTKSLKKNVRGNNLNFFYALQLENLNTLIVPRLHPIDV